MEISSAHSKLTSKIIIEFVQGRKNSVWPHLIYKETADSISFYVMHTFKVSFYDGLPRPIHLPIHLASSSDQIRRSISLQHNPTIALHHHYVSSNYCICLSFTPSSQSDGYLFARQTFHLLTSNDQVIHDACSASWYKEWIIFSSQNHQQLWESHPESWDCEVLCNFHHLGVPSYLLKSGLVDLARKIQAAKSPGESPIFRSSGRYHLWRIDVSEDVCIGDESATLKSFIG